MENNKVANLLILLKMLETRLAAKQIGFTDFSGIQVETSIYTTDRLMTFLEMSLSEFNQVPYFTNFSFEDDKFIEQFSAILVEGAAIIALASQSLLEKGKEYAFSNGGVSHSPPEVSFLLDSQYSQMYSMHWNKLKYIKRYIKDFDPNRVI